MRNLNKKQNLVEQARIKLDEEKIAHSITQVRVEELENIIKEQDKELELERKSRQLLTDDLANVCGMSLKKDNIIKEAIEYIHWRLDNRQDMYITQMKELLEILRGDKE